MKIFKKPEELAKEEGVSRQAVHRRVNSGKYLKVTYRGKKLGYLSVKVNAFEIAELVGKYLSEKI